MTSARCLFTAVVLTVTVLAAQARTERVVEKTFPVSGTGTLRLETHGGSIQVLPSNDSVVRITARQKVRADRDDEADRLLEKLELTFEQNGDDVRAVAKYESHPLGFHSGSWPPVQVDFVATVPASFATELRTSGGGITVGDLTGKANARTSGGSIKLGRMGGEVSARTSGGGITVAEARGPAEVRTSGGSIKVGRVAAPAKLSTSGGSITIEAVEGALDARTSGGSIRAGITGSLQEGCTLSTAGGSVQVTVDQKAAFQLDASSSGGGVNAKGLALTLEKSGRERNRLAGAVNGGGPPLKLRASGGGISIRAR